jgi:hypothetical protein
LASTRCRSEAAFGDCARCAAAGPPYLSGAFLSGSDAAASPFSFG